MKHTPSTPFVLWHVYSKTRKRVIQVTVLCLCVCVCVCVCGYILFLNKVRATGFLKSMQILRLKVSYNFPNF